MGILWRKLTGWLKPKDKLINLSSEIIEVKKIAIIVGHTRRSPGAHIYKNECGFFNEYDFNELIAERVALKLKVQDGFNDYSIRVYRKDGIGTKGVAKKIGDWGADVSIELHLNAFSKKAFGCELLLLENSPEKLGKDFISDFSYYMDITKRHVHGIKWVKKNDRGFDNLHYCLKSGVKYPMLLEPCFANFKTSDSIKVIEGYQNYANVLHKIIRKLYGPQGNDRAN